MWLTLLFLAVAAVCLVWADLKNSPVENFDHGDGDLDHLPDEVN